jgi:hypothetical protein
MSVSRSKRSRGRVLIAGALLLLLSGAVAWSVSIINRPRLSQQSEFLRRDEIYFGDLVLDWKWLELAPKQALAPLPGTKSSVVLFLRNAAEGSGDSWLIPKSDAGPLNVPELDVVDDRGGIHSISGFHFRQPDALVFECYGLPTDRTYPKIKIRSLAPLAISQVLWQVISRNPKY